MSFEKATTGYDAGNHALESPTYLIVQPPVGIWSPLVFQPTPRQDGVTLLAHDDSCVRRGRRVAAAYGC
jgi:hypothetical protein